MQTLAQSFYLGPFAIYTSSTGLTDPITGLPELGGTLHEGDYVDLSDNEAGQWSQRFGPKLYQGRYRFVRLSPAATAANIAFGKPCGWGIGNSVEDVGFVPGTGYTPGSYILTATGGTNPISQAVVQVVVGATGSIIGAQVLNGGQYAYGSAAPTFSLTPLGAGTGGSVLAKMYQSANLVSSVDASSVGGATGLNPRGIFLSSPTASQIAAGCWVVIQELGIAPVLITTGASVAAGGSLNAGNNGAVTAAAAGNITQTFLGTNLDIANVGAIVRGVLELPVLQG
jgi:hypothetical protein